MSDTATTEDTRAPSFTTEEKSKYVINRQDKDYVLYAGLLMLSHRIGLSKIETTLLQIPNQENGQCAIVQAWVTVAHGTFSGIADATPGNVNRMMANAIIRMAETRAKARAMRDAVNASAWALNDDVSDDLPDGEQPTTVQAQATLREMIAEERALATLPNGSGPAANSTTSGGSGARSVTPTPSGSRSTWPAPTSSAGTPPGSSSKPNGNSTSGSSKPAGTATRATTPVDQDLVPTLPVALRKWELTVAEANSLGIVIPVMTDAQMKDPVELQVEGRKLRRAIGMKQVEQKQAALKAAAEQRSGA